MLERANVLTSQQHDLPMLGLTSKLHTKCENLTSEISMAIMSKTSFLY